MRERACAYPDVDAGTACTQSSFKVRKKAFFFVGEQGGRFKAMFKLDASRDQAFARAAEAPDDTQIGSGVWVTARFSADKPLPKRVWTKWLDESYALTASPKKKPAAKKKTTAKKKATR